MSAEQRHCHSCDYALQGLGEAGRCPECGWDFHPGASVVFQHTTRQLLGQLILPLGGLVPFLAVWYFLERPRPGLRYWGVPIFYTALVLFWMIMLRFPRFRRGRVLLNRRAVRFIAISGKPVELEWSAFDHAECSRVTGDFALRDSDGGAVFKTDYRNFGGKWKTAARMVDEINQARSCYAGEQIGRGEALG